MSVEPTPKLGDVERRGGVGHPRRVVLVETIFAVFLSVEIAVQILDVEDINQPFVENLPFVIFAFSGLLLACTLAFTRNMMNPDTFLVSFLFLSAAYVYMHCFYMLRDALTQF